LLCCRHMPVMSRVHPGNPPPSRKRARPVDHLARCVANLPYARLQEVFSGRQGRLGEAGSQRKSGRQGGSTQESQRNQRRQRELEVRESLEVSGSWKSKKVREAAAVGESVRPLRGRSAGRCLSTFREPCGGITPLFPRPDGIRGRSAVH